jgi:DNA-3-methyladenine glycosylase II
MIAKAKGASRKAAAKKSRPAKPTKAKVAGKKTAPKKRMAVPPARSPKTKAAPRRKKAARKPAKPAVYHPGPLIDGESALADALQKLLALDHAIISRMIELGGPPPLRRREPGFAGLAAIIVSQQVSVASANAIFGRLEAALSPLSAATLIAAEDELLRKCGLSSPKIRALRALAHSVDARDIDLESLGGLDAIEAHRALIAVKGIGPWTADIFLLFCLGHPDAFPAGDLALQEAARLALGLKTRPDARRLEKIAERWRPVRGVAARLLWSYYRVARGREGVVLAPTTG